MLLSKIVCRADDISKIRHRVWFYILGVFFKGMV